MTKFTGGNCFSFSHMLHVQSTIGHIHRYALGLSREYSIVRGSRRNTSALNFPMHSYDSTRIPFVVTPNALRLRTKEHMKGKCKRCR